MTDPAPDPAGPGPATAPEQQAYRDLKKRFKLPRAVRRPLLWLMFAAGLALVGYEVWVAIGAMTGVAA